MHGHDHGADGRGDGVGGVDGRNLDSSATAVKFSESTVKSDMAADTSANAHISKPRKIRTLPGGGVAPHHAAHMPSQTSGPLVVVNSAMTKRFAIAVMASLCVTGLVATATQPRMGNVYHPEISELALSPSGDVTGVSDSESAVTDDESSQELPTTINDDLSDDDLVVASDKVLKSDGTLVDAETGEEITDPAIVGTETEPPDPLAKTDGESFIPVTVGDAREITEESGDSSTMQDSVDSVTSDGVMTSDAVTATNASDTVATDADGSATSPLESLAAGSAEDGSVALAQAVTQNSSYGAYWGTYNGMPAMFNRNGTVAIQDAAFVIDVSEHQKTIDWAKAKAAGVQGAIIRLGYGADDNLDKRAAYNIQQCKKLNIPFGIYWYSYSDTPARATAEANSFIRLMQRVGLKASDLTYPIYYDLEKFVWTGHPAPSSPSVYNGIVSNFLTTLSNAGYKNTAVYSYTSYLNTALNSTYIHQHVGWVAQYSAKLQYSAWTLPQRGWQYSSTGSINGISGHVDLNAMTDPTISNLYAMTNVTIPNGTYYINSLSNDAYALDIVGAQTSSGVAARLWSANSTGAQKFTFTRQGDGTYRIDNANSGLCLEVVNGVAKNGARIQQNTWSGASSQKWYVRSDGKGGFLIQSALGNWALDLAGNQTANNGTIQLFTPNGTKAQRWEIASADVSVPTGTPVKIASSIDSGKVLTVSGSSTANGAKVQLNDWSDSSSQLYEFTKKQNGVYSAKVVSSGKVLDVPANATANDTQIQQYASNGTAAQHWYFFNEGSGKVSIVGAGSGKVLDVPAASAKNGTSVNIYATNGTAAQKWSIEQASVRTTVPVGTYYIRSARNLSYVLDVTGGSNKDSANVQLYSSNRTGAQQWKVSVDSDGYVTFTNVRSGKVLDLCSAKAVNGGNLQQYRSNGTKAQKWKLVSNGDGSFVIQSAVNPSYVIDLDGDVTKNGSNLQVYRSNGTKAQSWYFSAV